jgi:peptide methionine sulfoxide reductase MsrA
VRIVDHDKKDILPRLNGNYTPSGLVNYMMMALKKTGQQIPDYVTLLFEELNANERGLEKTTLSMYCFWTGEKELGKIDGVMQTEAGFMDHREVVNVYYDPEVVSLEHILQEGRKTKCADQIYYNNEQQRKEANNILGNAQMKAAGKFSPDKDPKYYLAQTVYKYLPMTPAQAVKINALIGQGKSPAPLLSPRQRVILDRLKVGSEVSWASCINDKKWEEKMFRAWKELVQRV